MPEEMVGHVPRPRYEEIVAGDRRLVVQAGWPASFAYRFGAVIRNPLRTSMANASPTLRLARRSLGIGAGRRAQRP